MRCSLQISFHCAICDEEFPSYIELKRHKLGYVLRTCPVEGCAEVSDTDQLLLDHIHLVHGLRGYQCRICKKIYSVKRDLECHLFAHIHEPYSHLENPFLMHIDLLEYTIECADCEFLFSMMEDFKDHHHTVHKDKECASSEQVDKPADVEPIDLLQELQSNDNGSSFSVAEEFFGEASSERFMCPVCDKLFLNKASLRRHMMNYISVERYMCAVCGTTFKRREFLRGHLMVNPVEKYHKCDICRKSFLHKTGFVKHLSMHYNPRVYSVCPNCEGKTPIDSLCEITRIRPSS